MIGRLVLSVVVAVVTGVVVSLVGHALLDAGVQNTGSYLTGVSVLLGVLAGIWYFFKGPLPNRV